MPKRTNAAEEYPPGFMTIRFDWWLKGVMKVNEMHVPINRPCIVYVMSRDVIHDFCVHNMRVAMDAIPGSIIPTWFVPIKPGTYEIVCAQLCGNGHSQMKGVLVVDSEADYKKWYSEMAKLSGAKVVDGQRIMPTSLAQAR